MILSGNLRLVSPQQARAIMITNVPILQKKTFRVDEPDKMNAYLQEFVAFQMRVIQDFYRNCCERWHNTLEILLAGF